MIPLTARLARVVNNAGYALGRRRGIEWHRLPGDVTSRIWRMK